MKKTVVSCLLILVVACIPLGFSDKNNAHPKEIVINYYNTQFKQLMQDLNAFSLAAKNKKKLDDAYLSLRETYKSLEPIYIYFDNDAIKKDINGAPLLKLEENTPGINIVQPKGLQVIDELIGAETYDYAEIERLSKKLKQNLNLLNNTIQLHEITHRHVIELYQLNLVKILTVEQSGFDTPGTLKGLTDSKQTLTTINKIIGSYLKSLSKPQKEIKAFLALSEKAEKTLNKAESFEEFNRLSFVKDYIEPLFSKINSIHHQSGVEYYDEISRFAIPRNLRSAHIFSDDFLVHDFYTGVPTNDTNLIKLGKTLFFDPVLSGNNKRACASCHNPSLGFTDGQKTSLAFDFKGRLDRNAPTLLNSTIASEYFWDLRATEVRNQIEHVVFNPKEFGTGFSKMENKLKQSAEYKKMFAQNFKKYNDDVINKNSISIALVAYVQSLSGWNSEFDKYVRSETETLNEQAKAGFNLFMGKAQCGICHFPPSFSGLVPPYFEESEAEVIGVTQTFDTINPILDSDLGRFASIRVGQNAPFWKHAFKTPTIRNTRLTGPYMHNGAFKTLDELLHFYNQGGAVGMGIELENQTLPASKLDLTSLEMAQIKSFIHSLTDTSSMDISMPKVLPKFPDSLNLNNRKIGGEY